MIITFLILTTTHDLTHVLIKCPGNYYIIVEYAFLAHSFYVRLLTVFKSEAGLGQPFTINSHHQLIEYDDIQDDIQTQGNMIPRFNSQSNQLHRSQAIVGLGQLCLSTVLLLAYLLELFLVEHTL